MPSAQRFSINERIVMPSPEFQTLLTLLILAGGAGIYLRVVANEKHRREFWLQIWLEDKMKELRKAKEEADSERIEATVIDDAQ